MGKHPHWFAWMIALVASTATAATVTEAQYLAAFTAAHPAAVALTQPLGAAQGRERSARTRANPILEVDHEAPGDARQWTASVAWTPPLDGRRGLDRRVASAGLEAAENEFAWSLLELRSEVRGLYADWALAAQRESLLTAHRVVLRTLVQRTEERQRAGEESGLTAQRLALALVELEANAARAGAEYSEAAHAALARSQTRFDAARPQLPALPAISDPDARTHPHIAARRAEVDAAEAHLRFSRRLPLAPQLRLGWQTQREPGFEADGLVLGGTWSMPLFDRQPGERIEAETRLRAARAALEVETARAQARRAASRESYERLRAAALQSATSLQGSGGVLERSAAKFRLGESDVTDLLETMRSVLSAHLAALDLHAAALAAHRQLELALGRPVESPGGAR